MTSAELKVWRERWSLSQAQLARMLGVIPLTVSRWETGDRDVPSMLPLALETLERRLAAELRQRADTAAALTGIHDDRYQESKTA